MRRLIAWDLRFQMKYGFYLLYAIVTGVYLILIAALPESFRKDASVILIFSDPAAMGLFFMGAIVLLEKSQRVLCAYAVSPMNTMKYTISKVISLMLISEVVAVVLATASGTERMLSVIIGTGVSSTVTTLAGLLIANQMKSLNQYILWTTPIEILVFVPAILSYFGSIPDWMSYYPSCVCIALIAGRKVAAMELVVLFGTVALLGWSTINSTKKSWMRLGGARV